MIKLTYIILKGSMNMTRRIKGLLISLLTLTAALITVFALCTTASAASNLEYSITYGTDGTATLNVVPRVNRNYITFTTDGTKPTYMSPILDESITVSEATYFRLAEYNIDNEYLWGIKLTVKPKVNKVEISEEYFSNLTRVKLSTSTEGAKIYYTLDGSAPTTKSKRYIDGYIQITEKTYIRAMAVKTGYKNSGIVKKKINVKSYIDSPVNKIVDKDDDAIIEGTKIKCSASYHSESASTYVTLSPQKSSNKIYYTTDGSAPSKSSKLYTKKLKFTSLKTIRAVEYTPSGKVAATLKYNVKIRCKEVEFTCTDTASGTIVVKMSCPTEGAKIYYTVTGKTPTTKSNLYTEPFMIGHTTQLKAIAIKDGYVNSAVKSVIGIDIPLDLEGFDYQEYKFTSAVDNLNMYLRWNGIDALEHDEKVSRAAQKRAIEAKVSTSDVRPNTQKWATVMREEKVIMLRGFEVIKKNTPIEKVLEAVLAHPNLKEYTYDKVGIGYNEYDGDYYWAVIVALY